MPYILKGVASLESFVPKDLRNDIWIDLCTGVINPGSRSIYAKIVERAAADGAHGIILGCTEIGLLLRPEDSPVPLFDTTKLHAEAAVKYAISG